MFSRVWELSQQGDTIVAIFISEMFYNSFLYFWFKYNLGQKYYTLQVQSDRGSDSWPPDHGNTFHATEAPALTTRAISDLSCITATGVAII